MDNKAYVIMQGEYSDRHVVKVCLDEKLAERICELHNNVTRYSPYYVEIYDISKEPDSGWTELFYRFTFAKDGEIVNEYHTDEYDISDYDCCTSPYIPYVRAVAGSTQYCSEGQYVFTYIERIPFNAFDEGASAVFSSMRERAIAILNRFVEDPIIMQNLADGGHVTHLETEDT